ncbi:hypothetical protein ACFTXJ_00155 [Streptomyces zhihengii]|uniref:hypothetical protein n=1 Tax=Streptomyces zhihengii TaxID=1818004 RepID=UPI0036368B24
MGSFTRAEALLAIVIAFLVGLVSGLTAGIIAASAGETTGTCFAWGGGAFVGMGGLCLTAAGLYLVGVRRTPTPPANSQQGAPVP